MLFTLIFVFLPSETLITFGGENLNSNNNLI